MNREQYYFQPSLEEYVRLTNSLEVLKKDLSLVNSFYAECVLYEEIAGLEEYISKMFNRFELITENLPKDTFYSIKFHKCTFLEMLEPEKIMLNNQKVIEHCDEVLLQNRFYGGGR